MFYPSGNCLFSLTLEFLRVHICRNAYGDLCKYRKLSQFDFGLFVNFVFPSLLLRNKTCKYSSSPGFVLALSDVLRLVSMFSFCSLQMKSLVHEHVHLLSKFIQRFLVCLVRRVSNFAFRPTVEATSSSAACMD